MTADQSRLVVGFAGLSHALFHIVAGLFLTLVLVLEPVWKLPYARLIELWTIGALLLGLGAPVAGWLSDRVGEIRLMIGFLLGMGASGVFCGLSEGPGTLQMSLAAMGLFGSIYHPVGIAWVVKNVRNRGRSMAIVGICGSTGIALASLVAGGIADFAGWRAAFIVPSVVMIGVGLCLAAAYLTGAVADREIDLAPAADPTAGDVRRAFFVLVVTMSLMSIAYHAFASMLPKWIEREIGASLGSGLTRIGALVSIIYFAGTIAQVIGGWLADRGLAREAYVASFGLQLVAILGAAAVGGWPIVVAAFIIVLVLDHASLVENILIARYTPSAKRGFAYGVRNGIGIVAGPLGVLMVSKLYDPARGFAPVLHVLASIALVIMVAAMFLPRERANPVTAQV